MNEEILAQVDQIVAQESNTLWVAVRVIANATLIPMKVNTAFMGLYATEAQAKEVCQRNTRATLKWHAGNTAETHWSSQAIRAKMPMKPDDPIPLANGESRMAYFVSEQKVRT